ncbi:MAG: lytic transglycosylase protein [Rhizobium sp.]|nr:lytic transglycosylase protein [Rhizobium sp.]
MSTSAAIDPLLSKKGQAGSLGSTSRTLYDASAAVEVNGVITLRMLVPLCLMGAMLQGAHFTSAAAQPVVAEKECLFERPASPGVLRICIRSGSYPQDVCRAIEHFSVENKLPAEYFARLIWRESLFRADAVSPKGAEGIAQFMPGTAKLRGLANSFDVVQALEASSRYLSDLRDRFGNLGLAAAAYNAGEDGLSNFLRNDRLPLETRDYVFAITGHPVETWQDDPPAIAAASLDPAQPFLDACIQLALSRRLREPILIQSADWAPWGVQLSAHFDPGIANRLFLKAVAKLPKPLSSERALIVRQKRKSVVRMRQKYAARIGRETRKEANDLCDLILKAGVACAVVKN